MKTMIPNQLKFDLDLQDLPARAIRVSSEALNSSGAPICANAAYTDDSLAPSYNSSEYCPDLCWRWYGGWWNGQLIRYASNRLYGCGCCHDSW